MIVKTDEIIALLYSPNIERDNQPPYGQYVGYREKNGRWFVFDESAIETETIFLIEDLVGSENYTIAAKVKKLVDSKKLKK